MDIRTVKKMEKKAVKSSKNDFTKLGLALFFMVGVLFYSSVTHSGVTNSLFLAIAALFGAYMALNIGANDVANNVGPAVGSRALTMGGAIIIAAIFEASGAIIAGGDVVGTIKKGIIDPAAFVDASQFIWAMTAALLAGGLWLNLATTMGAPVSTTHSIVGGVMGAGIAASGFGAVAWGTMGTIAASWVISPLLGGVIAALFLFTIKKTMIYKEDKLSAMKKMVPLYVAVMGWAFVTYLMLKGVKHIVKIDFPTALGIGFAAAVAIYFMVKPMVATAAVSLRNHRDDVNKLFTIPLIFAAALLSFAHGANDVANAVGPLAGIADAVQHSVISTKASIPMWVMLVGAIGIALGLALYGPKLIRTVGSEITELDQVRAYSIAMAAAITVIVASQLGLPVSSTHIAIGGVFGVGFLREFLYHTKEEELIRVERRQLAEDEKVLNAMNAEKETLEAKEGKSQEDYERIVQLYQMIEEEEEKIRIDKKQLKRAEKIKYVKRDAIKKIIAAWVITVPAAAVLSAAIFYTIRGMML
ncbi:MULTISPECIES: inorganic phosphate transporter [Sulfurimonas]|uniref:Phosphate transporter n=1 Tax=Sulfurimonas diazotrophicus TaxID=3131939 RepID=A0ABZ3H6V2_9BACT